MSRIRSLKKHENPFSIMKGFSREREQWEESYIHTYLGHRGLVERSTSEYPFSACTHSFGTKVEGFEHHAEGKEIQYDAIGIFHPRNSIKPHKEIRSDIARSFTLRSSLVTYRGRCSRVSWVYMGGHVRFIPWP